MKLFTFYQYEGNLYCPLPRPPAAGERRPGPPKKNNVQRLQRRCSEVQKQAKFDAHVVTTVGDGDAWDFSCYKSGDCYEGVWYA